VSALPDPAYPCGTSVPNAAMASPGQPGELLVDLGLQIVPMLTGPAWAGPGSPSPFSFPIPAAPPLVTLTVWLQGALFHPGTSRIGATNGLAVRIGP